MHLLKSNQAYSSSAFEFTCQDIFLKLPEKIPNFDNATDAFYVTTQIYITVELVDESQKYVLIGSD